MNKIEQKILIGERALFNTTNAAISYCTFKDGESPLKESSKIELNRCNFEWKYPVWYCNDVIMNECVLLETARSGIWYTNNITINDTTIDAPKTFRRSSNITLNNVTMVNALETLWNCENVTLNNVTINGDYFGFNCKKVTANNISISGNYCFDGASNIHIKNSKLISKDAFWNCENVTVENCIIVGEYLAWNAKNITFINCEIESLQGLCYINNLVMKNCRLINTTLAFEYSDIDAQINGSIDSVFNINSGTLYADEIKELIMDETKIDKKKTKIIVGDKNEI